MTTLAVGLLLLDGILLLVAGWWTRRWYLIGGGTVLLVLCIGVIAYYRSYRRALLEVERARDLLRGEFQELRRMVEQRERESAALPDPESTPGEGERPGPSHT